MESRRITNTENVINSRKLFVRIKQLEHELNYHCSDSYLEEYKKTIHAPVDRASSPDAAFRPVDFDSVTYWLRQ